MSADVVGPKAGWCTVYIRGVCGSTGQATCLATGQAGKVCLGGGATLLEIHASNFMNLSVLSLESFRELKDQIPLLKIFK